MDRHEGLRTALPIALNTGLILAIIMYRNAGPQTAVTIALHRGL
jgi:hypothetical protein